MLKAPAESVLCKQRKRWKSYFPIRQKPRRTSGADVLAVGSHQTAYICGALRNDEGSRCALKDRIGPTLLAFFVWKNAIKNRLRRCFSGGKSSNCVHYAERYFFAFCPFCRGGDGETAQNLSIKNSSGAAFAPPLKNFNTNRFFYLLAWPTCCCRLFGGLAFVQSHRITEDAEKQIKRNGIGGVCYWQGKGGRSPPSPCQKRSGRPKSPATS